MSDGHNRRRFHAQGRDVQPGAVTGGKHRAPSAHIDSPMRWFPKAFGPGDIDGVGARRLLGTPSVEPADVLVRETGQNSWDARGGASSIDFCLNLFRLDSAQVDMLRRQVFTGDAHGTGLRTLLAKDEIWALEVSDRGTVGLNGPVRNDLAVADGAATNFIDLVLNIGAPRDVHLGGGTYGFGKTISYVVSSVGTVLMWTRCWHRGVVEDRLIGSAMGNGFDMDGLRYTGRHWWGRVVDGGERVQPLVGTEAQRFAEPFFSKPFTGDETGTSVLILDPQFGGESPEEDVESLARAVSTSLWPKLVPVDEQRSEMRISVQLEGTDVPIPALAHDPAMAGRADCLQAVRAVQAGKPLPEGQGMSPVVVEEVRSQRPKKVLGHVAFTRRPCSPSDEPQHSVTLMRHEAELVVKELRGRPLDVAGFQWVGVFKPVDVVDDSFALAEPPAHDDWVPSAVSDKQMRRDVNVALKRLKELTDDFASPSSSSDSRASELPSAAVTGDALAALLGGIQGSGPSANRSGVSGSATKRPKVAIEGADVELARPGWTRTTVLLSLAEGGRDGADVRVRLRVGVDGGSEEAPDMVRVLGWEGTGTEDVRHIGPRERVKYVFDARDDVAVDVDASVVVG